MKSKFFKDTQGLESAFEVCTPDKISVCLRFSKDAYEYALVQAARLEMTSGEYIEKILLAQRDMQPQPTVANVLSSAQH